MATPTASIEFVAEECRELAFGSIGVNYSAIGTSFAHPIRMLFIQNLTSATLWFSLDGTTNHFPLPTNGFFVVDITTNKSNDRGFFVRKGSFVHVKQLGAPASGSVYVSAFYGKE